MQGDVEVPDVAIFKGNKFDEDPYSKIDLTLIPWFVLEMLYPYTPGKEFMHELHLKLSECMDAEKQMLGSDCERLLKRALGTFEVKLMAVSLGYGVNKYGRNNWKRGFGGDPNRFLRACLRHCHHYLMGEDYDGERVIGYKLGNSHEGAILFSLMVALCECNIVPVPDNGEA